MYDQMRENPILDGNANDVRSWLSLLDWYMYLVSDCVLFCKLFSDLPYVLVKSQHTNKRRPL